MNIKDIIELAKYGYTPNDIKESFASGYKIDDIKQLASAGYKPDEIKSLLELVETNPNVNSLDDLNNKKTEPNIKKEEPKQNEPSNGSDPFMELIKEKE